MRYRCHFPGPGTSPNTARLKPQLQGIGELIEEQAGWSMPLSHLELGFLR